MPLSRWRPEKLEALAASLATGDSGQQAVAADLLARLTEQPESARLLCGHPRGEALLQTCLELAACPSAASDVRADILSALKNAMAVEEGKALICKDSFVRPILEAPPPWRPPRPRDGSEANAAEPEPEAEVRSTGAAGDAAAPAEGSDTDTETATEALASQAWLGFALTTVVATDGGVLASCDLAALQDAVSGFSDHPRGAQAFVDGLSLLRHIYEWKVPSCALDDEECRKLARAVRSGLSGGDHASGASAAEDDVVGHALRLVALVGTLPPFRAALLQVEPAELETQENLSERAKKNVEITLGQLFTGLQRIGSSSPAAWKAMFAMAEVKCVRRVMRDHSEVKGLFQCLKSSLLLKDPHLEEPIVAFLKQIFTGATDQFPSTDPVMFTNLGRTEGVNQLLDSLLASARYIVSTPHRSNIVAFLADAMFFSCFTDAWQIHDKAKDLIDLLFDALLWKGVEGTAGLALGNFVSANGHIDLILDHERSAYSMENVGWFMKRTSPGWDTKMQIYYLWRVLRSHKGCRLLCRNPHAADLVVAGLLRGIRHATVEDNEVLSLLECFLQDDAARPFMLRGPNPSLLLDGVRELLSSGEKELCEPCCQLVQALTDATSPTVLLTYQGAPRLLSELSSRQQAKELLGRLVPMLQWEPALVQSLCLEYKRTWISEHICSKEPGDAVSISACRGDILRGVRESLRDPSRLQHGLEVKFNSAGETGSGDGHRREFFRLAAEALTDLEFGLFKSSDGGRTLHPSSTAKDAQPECLAYFELCGKLIALALMHRETLPAMRFTSAMLKMILGVGPLTVEDMASVDPEYYRHKVKYILEARYAEGESPMTIDDLELAFEDTPQPDVFPGVRNELCPKGSQIRVTEENKGHYVDLLVDSRVRGSVQAEVQALVQGVRLVIQDEVWDQIQRIVSPAELDLLTCGLQELDLADWRANSTCSEGVDQETWDTFWKVVEGFSTLQQKELLEFVTGSSGLPVGGFAALSGYGSSVHKFCVAASRRGSLPAAQTCFNTLYLPECKDEAEMSAKLLEAIANRDAGGFYEGAVLSANSHPAA